MSERRVGMVLIARGLAADRAVQRLSDALEGAVVEPPGDDGTFDVRVDAPSFEGALEQVWDGVAAAGVDDQIAFAEHPDIPGHWRHRTRTRP